MVEMVDTPAAALLLAYLNRLATDHSLLELQNDPVSTVDRSRHKPKGRICHGCPKCDGPIWAHKTESVAVLWANFCEYISHVMEYHKHAMHGLYAGCVSMSCISFCTCVSCNISDMNILRYSCRKGRGEGGGGAMKGQHLFAAT